MHSWNTDHKEHTPTQKTIRHLAIISGIAAVVFVVAFEPHMSTAYLKNKSKELPLTAFSLSSSSLFFGGGGEGGGGGGVAEGGGTLQPILSIL